LESGAASYRYGGGLGAGVYVGTEVETAQFYGQHVYELRTNFGWDQVLAISPEDNYTSIGSGYDSILVGEQVPPFAFMVGDKKYAVTSGEGGYDDDERYEKEAQWKALYELVEDEEYYPLVKTFLEKMESGDDWPPDEYEQDDIENHVFAILDNQLTTERGVAPEEREVLDRAQAIAQDVVSKSAIATQQKADIGEQIGLDDVGSVVEQAGYKAVYVEGIRLNSSVNEEMLVFNESDLIMVGELS